MSNEYELAKSLAVQLIVNHQKSAVLEPHHIAEYVATTCAMQLPGLESVDQARLVRDLEAHFETIIGAERELVGDDEGWSPWLDARYEEIDWRLWNRYRRFLSTDGFSDAVLRGLGRSTERVVGLLGDPAAGSGFDRRGLVVGLVQSGKTAHYTGVINRALDTGYKVVIVLTGFTESLRQQTQSRIEQGVLGYSLRPHPERPASNQRVRCGVGDFDPGAPRTDSVTTCGMDFRRIVANNFGVQMGNSPLLFVVKKNVTVLRNLLDWVTNFHNSVDPDQRKYVSRAPLLVIDDESDVGSVDTRRGAITESGAPDLEHDPTKINKQIRKLLCLFDQSSYVGYTATPFANVLIHEDEDAEIDSEDNRRIGPGLFPRSFIVALPTPSNHVGPGMIFGGVDEDGQVDDGLPIIRSIEDTELGPEVEEFWMPPKHKKEHVPLYLGENRVPPSLREAFLSFLLVCAERRLRGDGAKPNSMLIHVTRFVDVQRRVGEQVEQELAGIRDRLRNGAAQDGLLRELRHIWEEAPDSFANTTESIRSREGALFENEIHPWNAIRAELVEVISGVQVRLIHGQSGEELDYEAHPDGLDVIAIGGDKLARGLTLSGLSVSYFLRSSRMYDTLMQMGRWFGYRPGYLDLCRLYTTPELSEWFFHIACATSELFDEFGHMANLGLTPRQFGIRVKSHPELMVTSQVKRRHAEEIQISFQGSLVQTVNFWRNSESLTANWEVGCCLVRAIDEGNCRRLSGTREGVVAWEGVTARPVLDFLSRYQGHKAAHKARTDLLSQYVESEAAVGRLDQWTVVVSGKRGGVAVQMGSIRVGMINRSWHVQGDEEKQRLIRDDHFRIKVLTHPPDLLIGLSEAQKEQAIEYEINEWRRMGGHGEAPSRPSSRSARLALSEQEGLLVLYPIDPGDDAATATDLPILGFAVSFPAVGDPERQSCVSYTVNNVYQREEALSLE